MTLDEVVILLDTTYNITKFYQNQTKNIKILYIKHLMDGPSVNVR